METGARHDLHISGTGRVPGGVLGNVTIEGLARITGDIDCLDFTVDGVARARGNITARSGRVNGFTAILGDWRSEDLVTGGFSRISGDIAAKRIKVEGFTRLGRRVAAQEVEITGYAGIKGDCEAETFVSRGVFAIDGMLNAGDIDILAVGKCRARDVGGGRIDVRTEPSNVFVRLATSALSLAPGLVAETVEGDDIYLEYTRAGAVRGNNVKIGPGCVIGLVEYRDAFERDRGTEIKEVRKTGSGA